MMTIDKSYILNALLREIFNISDIYYQERIWVRGEGPEWDSFDETVCSFIEYFELVEKDYKNYGISEKNFKILEEFKNIFYIFSREYSTPEESLFIHTQEWKQIMEMASEVLKSFNYKNP